MHANAAGLSIHSQNIDDFINSFNELYKEVDQTPVYHVDYIWNKNTLDIDKILEIGGFNIYGQEIPESLVVIKDICLAPNMITLMSPDKNPTLKIQIGEVSVIKFKSSQEEYEQFCQEDMVLTAVCKCNINEWNNNVYPQLLIEDFELKEELIF